MAKITIVGAGNVGATAAHVLATQTPHEIVLVDIVEGLPQGKALDLAQALAAEGRDARIAGANSYGPTKGSDLIVITAGIARKPGMTREDLVRTNAGIVRDVAREAAARSPHAVMMVVSNPLDVMCHVAHAASGFPRERVVGMAGALDSARLAAAIAHEAKVPVKDVHALVLGSHGDLMVALPGRCTVRGEPLARALPRERIDAAVAKAREGGAEIVGLLGTSAYYAPAACIARMARAILDGTGEIVPCAALLSGEYGISGAFIGVPVRLGEGGILEIVEIGLSSDEKAALAKAAASVRELADVALGRA